MENLFHQFVNSEWIIIAIAIFSVIYFVVTYYNAWMSLEKGKELKKAEAINYYKERYYKTPKEDGFPVVGIYEKQSAYLYATSEKVIQAFKTQQNMIRWIMVWYFLPFPFIWIGLMATYLMYTSLTYPTFIACSFFMALWSILGIVLMIKVWNASRIVKLGNNITYINYI